MIAKNVKLVCEGVVEILSVFDIVTPKFDSFTVEEYNQFCIVDEKQKNMSVFNFTFITSKRRKNRKYKAVIIPNKTHIGIKKLLKLVLNGKYFTAHTENYNIFIKPCTGVRKNGR